MNKLIDIIKGFLLGVANVIPGASGGTIAVLTGIFDRLIDNISNCIKHPFKSVKNLIYIIIGVLLGLVISIFVIEKLIEVAPIPTFFFFSGLIIGGIPFLAKKVKGKTKGIPAYTIFGLAVCLIIGLIFASEGATRAFDTSVGSMLILFFLGMIALMAMILPGVSGSMILATLGYYEAVLELVSTSIKDLISFNFNSNILLLICFSLGAIFGLVCFAKILKFLLAKYFTNTFMGILGLVSASSVAVIILSVRDYEVKYLFLGIITLVLGVISGLMLTKLEGDLDD